MWWQLRRISLFVLALDAAAVFLAAVGCLAFGSLTQVNLGTVLFVGAVVLAFAAAGFGDGPARLPFPASSRTLDRALMEDQFAQELERGVNPSTSSAKQMFRGGPSWPLALGLAAIPLVALSAFLVGAFE